MELTCMKNKVVIGGMPSVRHLLPTRLRTSLNIAECETQDCPFGPYFVHEDHPIDTEFRLPQTIAPSCIRSSNVQKLGSASYTRLEAFRTNRPISSPNPSIRVDLGSRPCMHTRISTSGFRRNRCSIPTSSSSYRRSTQASLMLC